MALRREIKLLSPVGAEPAVFPWPLASFDGREGFEELRISFNFVCEDIPELRMPCQNILSEVDTSSYDSVKESCERFNRAVVSLQRMWKGTSCSKKYLERHRPSNALLKHILLQCYYRAVTEPEKLNQYPPFSPEVYGETSFELVEKMVNKIKWPENALFIDLGSGVGQVVLQIAAAVPQLKMAYGVERADLPSAYARAMDTHFRFWMSWYGKSHSDYQLVKEDFLTTRWSDVISEADVVFANNFAFGPQVNHELKQRIQHMKEGSKIVSSLSLCPSKFEITERNLSDIAAILRVEELSITHNTPAVSWTGRDFSFYLHTVDRTMLERYFERKVRREKFGNTGSASASHSSSSSVTNDDSMASGKSGNSNNAEVVKNEAAAGSPFVSSVPNGHQQQNGELAEAAGDDSSDHHKEKKKSKRGDSNGEGSSHHHHQQAQHRGRGRPAKIPRLSSTSSSGHTPVVVPSQTLKKSSSIKSTLKGAEEIILSESSEKKKRKRDKEHDGKDEQETPSQPKSLKTSIKMPPGLDLLYRRVVTSTTQPDLSTREGRIDAFLAKFKAQMLTFLEHSAQKSRIEARLQSARRKNIELKEKEKSLCQELSQLASQNHARLRQQVDSLSSLGSSLTSKVPTVQTLAEFVAESKRIVKRNVNLRDLMSNSSNSSSNATGQSQPSASTAVQQSPTTSAPPSYPLAPFQTAQQPQRLTEAQQQQAVSLFNSTLAALLPFYSNNPSISNHQNMLISPFLSPPQPQDMMRQLTQAGAGQPSLQQPWFPAQVAVTAPLPPQNQTTQSQQSQQQQQPPPAQPPPPPPPPTTTSSGPTPTPVPASVEEALKAIMATASIVSTDKLGANRKGRRSGTPQIEAANAGTTTPDGTVKKTPQRRTPSKPRKQGEGGGGTSPPHQIVMASSDMAEFLSHMRLPEPHPRPPSVVATAPATTVASTTVVAATTTATTTTSTTTTSSSKAPSGPVFHISSMVFRPTTSTTASSTVNSDQQPATSTTTATTPTSSEVAAIPAPEVQPSQA